MALKYHLVKRRDMRKDAPVDSKLFYGQVRATGRITFDRLCAEVSRGSTASKGDAQVVITTMLESMVDHLKDGHIVQMGDLGSFRFSAGSKGVENQEDFNTTTHFKGSRIVFTPGPMLRSAKGEIGFEKIQPLKAQADEGESGGF